MVSTVVALIDLLAYKRQLFMYCSQALVIYCYLDHFARKPREASKRTLQKVTNYWHFLFQTILPTMYTYHLLRDNRRRIKRSLELFRKINYLHMTSQQKVEEGSSCLAWFSIFSRGQPETCGTW